MYVAALNTYMTLIPSNASNVLDNDRHCPIQLSEEDAMNETLVNELKEVSNSKEIVLINCVNFVRFVMLMLLP